MLKLGFKEANPQRRPKAVNIDRQIRFGVARGLTETAKEGQKAVVGAMKGTFTLRGRWFEQSNRFGIKIQPAKRDNLTAEIRTRADWLEMHEKGGIKRPKSSSRLAIPTENVRRNKRDIITKANRPGRLRGKRTFVIKTSKGDVLFQRKYKGKRSHIVALYSLEPRARIKRQSTFFTPIEKVVKRRAERNIWRSVQEALRTAR